MAIIVEPHTSPPYGEAYIDYMTLIYAQVMYTRHILHAPQKHHPSQAHEYLCYYYSILAAMIIDVYLQSTKTRV